MYYVSQSDTERQMTYNGQQHGTEPILVFVCLVSPKETSVIVDPPGAVVEGRSVTLICSSRANPPVTNYTWYKDDEQDEESGQSLVINHVNLSHSGSYHCEVKNDLGEETSATIQLDIQCKSILTQ